MVGGTTKSGFTFEVNERLLKDWDFLERLDTLRNEPSKASMKDAREIYELLIGADGFAALKDHVRALNDGIALVEKINIELAEICEIAKVKN